MAIRLQKLGLKIKYAHLNNIPYYINVIDKIFITSSCVYSNGNIITDAGAAPIAIFAHIYKKPVYLFTRTYKFSMKTQIDFLSINESSTHKLKNSGHDVFELKHDLLPCKYVTAFVTEIGTISPTSVPMLVKRFSVNFERSLKEVEELKAE